MRVEAYGAGQFSTCGARPVSATSVTASQRCPLHVSETTARRELGGSHSPSHRTPRPGTSSSGLRTVLFAVWSSRLFSGVGTFRADLRRVHTAEATSCLCGDLSFPRLVGPSPPPSHRPPDLPALEERALSITDLGLLSPPHFPVPPAGRSGFSLRTPRPRTPVLNITLSLRGFLQQPPHWWPC